MTYNNDNIKILEKVYWLMINLTDVKDEKLRQQEIQKAGKLMAQVGLIKNTNDTHAIIRAYNKHVFRQIRNFIKKTEQEAN